MRLGLPAVVPAFPLVTRFWLQGILCISSLIWLNLHLDFLDFSHFPVPQDVISDQYVLGTTGIGNVGSLILRKPERLKQLRTRARRLTSDFHSLSLPLSQLEKEWIRFSEKKEFQRGSGDLSSLHWEQLSRPWRSPQVSLALLS